MTAARRKRRPAIAVLTGVALALLAFETLLQVAALVIWRRHRDTEVGADRRVVLCVGDSFTWGLGASTPDQAYPAQAEQRARTDGMTDVTFVNAGWPGRSSRDVLLRQAPLLRSLRPRLVYVLVGTNDAWRWPEFVPAGVEDTGADQAFPLCWRTGRLMLLVWDWLRRGREPPPSRADAAEPSVVGAWVAGPVQVDLWPDGTGGIAGRPFTWRLEDGKLVLHAGDGLEQVLHWRVVDGSLEVASPGWPRRSVCVAASRACTARRR